MVTKQQANTIILDFGSARKDDITDLRYGEGKLFKKVAKVVETLQDKGEVQENVQPIIVIVTKKSEKMW
ncbi:hypothetical protein [Roseofilum casamattae]|uniref:Uncharacterized protein n=1 Tax=Roseofilum casamattae BLCC-M143 TaxID=3022442 RepID=A0ABT7BWL1_9CYAN|nr:hypothetical protein [Roseofilum casamattae]MDJ1183556.1 hypothetical protein [Roseofilum casamattae BLCC-M143]